MTSRPHQPGLAAIAVFKLVKSIAGLGDGEAQSAELENHWGQRGLGLGTRYRVLLVSRLPLALEHY